jgi:hypothetical protein
MTGLAVAADYEAGQKMIRDRSFQALLRIRILMFTLFRGMDLDPDPSIIKQK